MPTATSPLPPVTALSKLPYLTATIQEATRIAHGVAGRLVRIAPDGSTTAFQVPENAEPEELALGSEGDLWFTGRQGRYNSEHGGSPGTGLIGRMTPYGQFATFPSPEAEGTPAAIATSPDGDLRFTDPGSGGIGSGGGPR